MPVTNGTLTQKVEVYNTVQYRYTGDWESGAMYNVASVSSHDANVADLNNPNYVEATDRKLKLAKTGVDIKQLLYSKDSWNAFQDVSSSYVDVSTGNLQLAKNGSVFQSSGSYIMKFNFSVLNYWNTLSYLMWSGTDQTPPAVVRASDGVITTQSGVTATRTIAVSWDGTNYTTVTQSDHLPDNTVCARFSGMTKNQSMVGLSCWIKITLTTSNTAYSPYVPSFCVYGLSSYKQSGIWTSPAIPISDIATLWDNINSFGWSGDFGGTSYYVYPEMSIDDGITWTTLSTNSTSGPMTIATTSSPFAKFRFRFTTTDTDKTGVINFIDFSYWSQLPANVLNVTENITDVVKIFDFTCTGTNLDATHGLLCVDGSFLRRVRVTRIVGTFSTILYGFINSKPRTMTYLGKESIQVKCFDESHIATQLLVNDSWPKYTNLQTETWGQILISAWSQYGPDWIDLNWVNNWPTTTQGGGGYPLDATCRDQMNILNDLPVTSIGEIYGTLYDLMNKFTNATGFSWTIDNKMLKVWQTSQANVNSTVLQTDVNVIGVPQINEDLPEIANSVFVMITNRNTGFTEIMNTIAGQQTYTLQYKPSNRSFQQTNGTTVFIDPPPQVWVDYNDSKGYIKLTNVVPDGATISNQVIPDATYNQDSHWLKLTAIPTADNAKVNGLKIVYTTQIDGIYQMTNDDSIAMFGERQHFISSASTRPAMADAKVLAANYLTEHAFPIQPVTISPSVYSFYPGEYVRVVIPAQGIDQLMPIAVIQTKSSAVNMDVTLTLNRAPLNDSYMIIDLFNRIRELEKPGQNADIPSELYKNKSEQINVTEYFTVTLT